MTKKIHLVNAVLAFCLSHTFNSWSQAPSSFVNPMIGTGGHGHTFPGPSRPFGMVQLSPDNASGKAEWDWCSGYHISDTTIVGFSHTHLSGTGIGDLGDVLLMPYIGQNPFREKTTEAYSSGFSHNKESASVGYYAVFLNKPKVNVELATTEKVGIHRYTFPASKDAKIVIDLLHKIYWGNTDEGELNVVNDSTITGYKILGSSWQRHRRVYFEIKFSKAFATTAATEEIIENKLVNKAINARRIRSATPRAYVGFETKAGEQILVKVAISAVSIKNASENMNEIIGWNFDQVVADTKNAWDQLLGKYKVEGSKKQKEIFYTALYHSTIAPNQIADATGEYSGPDYLIHKSNTGKFYSTFSLWDTYRAAHPLYTIIAPTQASDMVNSMMEHHKYNGYLPMWTLWGSDNHCMIANHSISVMTDAILKGLYTQNLDQVLDAMVVSTNKDHAQNPFQRTNYEKQGYFPYELEHESISKTLECAFNDWCVAQVALKLGNKSIYERYLKRAMYYQNLFHPKSKLMIPKDINGNWKTNFEPKKLGAGDVTEGNTWQYTWSVQHDPQGLINLFGSKLMFSKMLDSTFDLQNKPLDILSDVTGLIGQYAHGNEPSHHIAYLYNYGGEPWKAQYYVSKILKEQYNNTPDGICGNEDCGQMSAWYIWSATGLYPTNPVGGNYDFGSPIFTKTEINVGNQKIFTILAPKVSEKNIYIQSIKWNGKPYQKLYIAHQDIMNGGVLEFEMGDKPQKKLANYETPAAYK